ncbi:MAG: GPP34 family phosphoprotein [Acidimicrobiia bacterium]|nr:GPP34 family phosphoprotein [Acidimicrobiia bacterium]
MDGYALPLYEEVMLLALHDTKGTLARPAGDVAVAAAAISELEWSGRIELEGPKAFVDLVDASPTSDLVLDAVLDRLSAGKRRARLSTWLMRIAGIKDLRHIVARQLVADGVLVVHEKSFLSFDLSVYPELNPLPEQLVVERIRQAVVSEGMKVDGRTARLIGLADATWLLRKVLPGKEKRQHKARIKEMRSGDAVSLAAGHAVAAMSA